MQNSIIKTIYLTLLLLGNLQIHAQIFPAKQYGEMFKAVQTAKVFADSKTFLDCFAKDDPNGIMESYQREKDKSDFVLQKFVLLHFELPPSHAKVFSLDTSLFMEEHLIKLWSELTRQPDILGKEESSLIPLPYPYVVPGGRFREVYYWDSYFTMLGLQSDSLVGIIKNVVDNFSFLIDKYGFIPNGNRTYYLSRSQPPFFALMVSILEEEKGDSIYVHYQHEMEKEYAFWMDGSENLTPQNKTYRRLVRMPEGELLNRYWDDEDTPRPESYLEDMETAKEALSKIPSLSKEIVFRNLRAAAESGWDFSSRWLSKDIKGNYQLYTIHTTNIVPVDLNALLYNLEYTLYRSYLLTENLKRANFFKARLEARKKAIEKYCWSQSEGFFMDYNFEEKHQTPVFSLAGVYPLFFEIASNQQAEAIARKIQSTFLKEGGLVTTINNTGQQWDAPNGWAPLQWITVHGLRNYGYGKLANEIKEHWLNLNRQVYLRTYKMLEKYNVEDLSLEGGGGEYPNQDGFGWTNGVYQKLSKENNMDIKFPIK